MSDDTPAEPVHVCQDCGEEYRADIAVCADCGGEVVWRAPGQTEPPEAPAPPAPPGERGHVVFSSSNVKDLLPITERLRENAIKHTLSEQPHPERGTKTWAVVIRESDAARVDELIADLHGPHDTGGDLGAVAAHFDETHGYLSCPACGTPLPAGAHECAECGLQVGGEEAAPESGD